MTCMHLHSAGIPDLTWLKVKRLPSDGFQHDSLASVASGCVCAGDGFAKHLVFGNIKLEMCLNPRSVFSLALILLRRKYFDQWSWHWLEGLTIITNVDSVQSESRIDPCHTSCFEHASKTRNGFMELTVVSTTMAACLQCKKINSGCTDETERNLERLVQI